MQNLNNFVICEYTNLASLIALFLFPINKTLLFKVSYVTARCRSSRSQSHSVPVLGHVTARYPIILPISCCMEARGRMGGSPSEARFVYSQITKLFKFCIFASYDKPRFTNCQNLKSGRRGFLIKQLELTGYNRATGMRYRQWPEHPKAVAVEKSPTLLKENNKGNYLHHLLGAPCPSPAGPRPRSSPR